MFNESFAVLMLLAVAGPPVGGVGDNTLLASRPMGTVTKSFCREGLQKCSVTTSENREFVVEATYTNVAEKGAQLLLISVGRKGERQLCNMAGGVCARIISEKVR